MEADLPFDLIFSQAVCLAFVPTVTCSLFCVIGQEMQKNLVVLFHDQQAE